MKFNPKDLIVPHFWKKFFIMFFAIILMGFFLSFLIEAGWGTDPCSFMNINISSAIGWSLGNWQLLLNGCMFVIMFLLDPKLFGFGTVVNWVLIGYTADFCNWLWARCGLHSIILAPENFILHLAVFAVAIIGFIITATIYMNARMGLSPYDGVHKIIANKLSRIPFAIVRMCYDFLAIGIGMVASLFNPAGRQGSLIGSCIMAVCLGPTITFVGNFMQKHIFKEND